jgi:hypothetical protein
MNSASRLEQVIAAIDAANGADPAVEVTESGPRPAAVVYSERMTQSLSELCEGGEAGELVKIAVRAQHIRRWEIPRESYPMDRTGYLRWRTDLGRFHAKVTGEIMAAAEYSQAEVDRVAAMLTKRSIKGDPDTQLLEDVICLTFLRHYFDSFAAEHEADRPKVVNILRRTWNKMSEAGHAAAMKLTMTDRARSLVHEALSGPS